MKQNSHNPADYIVPLSIDGLNGRMMRVPATTDSKREILFVYGHHSSLERWWGLVEVLNRYGSVTMPDLPGFGGMDSFYTIGQKPTIDALADYLAAFIKWRYKRKKVTIAGMSFGFVIVTRMLQRYPELTSKVDLLVSIVGFAKKDDFTFSKPRYWFYRLAAGAVTHKMSSMIFRRMFLNRHVLRLVYARTHNAKKKFEAAETKEDFDKLMDIEIQLWQNNDIRTHMYTSVAFLTFDNTKKRVDLPVWHVSAKNDHYFDNNIVEQHMRRIFTNFHGVETALMTHAPSVIANAEMAEPLIPLELRELLSTPVN